MKFITCLSFLLTFTAQAALLEPSTSDKTLEGVKLAEKADVLVGKKKQGLTMVGAGLRYKKVVFVKAKVYVGQLFVSNPAKFERTEAGALDSLSHSNTIAMQMTFLRDVDAKTVQEAFSGALKENEVKETGAVAKFLDAVKAGGGAKDGKALVVMGVRSPAGETVTYEDADGKVVTINGGAGFIRDVFSLWLGKPADSGVENLKKEILGLKD